MSDSLWMLKYLQMSFTHGADLPWAVFKPSGLLLNVIVRHRNCTQMIRSEGHSVPLFMCNWIQEVSEKVYYNSGTQIKVLKSFFVLPKGHYSNWKDLKILFKTIRWAKANYRRTPNFFFFFSPAWKGLIWKDLRKKLLMELGLVEVVWCISRLITK